MRKSIRKNFKQGRRIGTITDNYSHEVLIYRAGQETQFVDAYAEMIDCMGPNGATYKVRGNNQPLSQRLRQVLLDTLNFDAESC